MGPAGRRGRRGPRASGRNASTNSARSSSNNLSPPITSRSSFSPKRSTGYASSPMDPSFSSSDRVSSTISPTGCPSAHAADAAANRRFTESIGRSESGIRSMSQSKMGFPATGRRGFGRSQVMVQSLLAYPPARMIVRTVFPLYCRTPGPSTAGRPPRAAVTSRSRCPARVSREKWVLPNAKLCSTTRR